jgi:hypothetical protein
MFHVLLQASQRASETASQVSEQAQRTAEDTKNTLGDKAQQVATVAVPYRVISNVHWLPSISVTVVLYF